VEHRTVATLLTWENGEMKLFLCHFQLSMTARNFLTYGHLHSYGF